MLKVMIVDDEIIVRVGFQSCINWEAHGCQVVSTCESGGDAVVIKFAKAITYFYRPLTVRTLFSPLNFPNS